MPGTNTSSNPSTIGISGPLNPFGSIHSEVLDPVFQGDAVYGINNELQTTTIGHALGGASSGVADSVNQMFRCQTGTIALSFATIQSKARMRYRPGQGIVGRFAGYFTAGVANSIQVIGFGSAESGFYFGYNGTSFGILYVTQGVRELHTLTVTTASTATNDYEITLPNTNTVTVTATNNGSTTQTAYEIAKGTFPGWKAEAIGATVLFLANSAGPTGGSFSLAQPSAGTPAAGSDVTTTTGVASTDTWIPQSSWNRDTMDGTTPSHITLDPTKGNVFEIGVQYLGFGTVSFHIETVDGDEINRKTLVHVIENPNALTRPHVSNPTFPFTMTAYSAGSTTNISVYAGSYAGFTEGQTKKIGPRSVVRSETNGYVTTSWKPLMSIQNALAYNNVANQNVAYLLSRSYSHDDTTPISFAIVRNPALTGPVNFQAFGNSSFLKVDKAATGMTAPSDSDLVDVIEMGQSGGGDYPVSDLNIVIQPGEIITVAAKTVTLTATYVNASVALREDQ